VGAQGKRIALLARRVTDALIVEVDQWPAGTFADPTAPTGRAAWYSLAFLLRLAAADLLDVSPNELGAGFRTVERDGRACGQAFLCDQLENGAGYCARLVTPLEFAKLLNRARALATEWGTGRHAAECDTSCNDCLRDYQTMPYHGLLDWRLALDMVTLLESREPLPFADRWQRLVSAPEATVARTLGRLGYEPPREFDRLKGFQHRTLPTVLLAAHPLWMDSHPDVVAAWALAERTGLAGVRRLDPFLAVRRPAEYV